MILDFVKMSPAENMTVFIINKLDRKDHIRIAKKLMKNSSIGCEQVGFIEESLNGSSLRLQMMGGEFCGNASRSFAAYMVHKRYPMILKEKDGSYLIPLEVSGLEKELIIKVKETPTENIYYSSVIMPLPERIEEVEFITNDKSINSTRVDFPGITHYIVDKIQISDRPLFFQLVKDKMKEKNYDAFGIMYYDFQRSYLEPLVYVKDTDTLIWERSCASGTCALGVSMSHKIKGSINYEIEQPGGTLGVHLVYENNTVSSISLDGLVEIVAEGKLYI